MKILTIGDVHGRQNWKNALYIDDITGEKSICKLDHDIDKVIFIGDYVDSFDVKNIDILTNLIEIIDLKNKYPDKVELLWGNHDVAYLNYDSRISGFRYEMAPELHKLFYDNRKLFNLSYQYKDILWTHAGVHKGWWKYYALPFIKDKNSRFNQFIPDNYNYSDILNLMFNFNVESIYMIGFIRGGTNKVGGPLWADKNELYNKSLDGIYQIVGHTPVDGIKTYEFKNNTKLTFVDSKIDNDFFELIV